MSVDGMKPKNYRRGRDLSIPQRPPLPTDGPCSKPFPCAVDIMVLAGLEQACVACGPHIPKLRPLHGYRQEGKFWLCDGLTPDQQALIRHRIGQADIRNWINREDE